MGQTGMGCGATWGGLCREQGRAVGETGGGEGDRRLGKQRQRRGVTEGINRGR